MTFFDHIPPAPRDLATAVENSLNRISISALNASDLDVGHDRCHSLSTVRSSVSRASLEPSPPPRKPERPPKGKERVPSSTPDAGRSGVSAEASPEPSRCSSSAPSSPRLPPREPSEDEIVVAAREPNRALKDALNPHAALMDAAKRCCPCKKDCKTSGERKRLCPCLLSGRGCNKSCIPSAAVPSKCYASPERAAERARTHGPERHAERPVTPIDGPAPAPTPAPVPRSVPDPTAAHPLQNVGLRDTITDIATEAKDNSGAIRIGHLPHPSLRVAIAREYRLCLEMQAQGSALEFALADEVMSVIPWLLLQRPGRSTKVSARVFERRLTLWQSGHLQTLHTEAKHHASNARTRFRGNSRGTGGLERQDDGWRVSVEHAENLRSQVGSGLLGQAARGLFDSDSGPPLEPSDEVLEKLKALHPDPRPDPDPGGDMPAPLPPGVFDGIDGKLIRSLAGQLRGGAGPSGLSSELLRLLCRAQGNESDKLCEAIAAVARRLASSPLPPGSLAHLIACRLVALRKGDNGIRPIGVGEVLRRLMCKSILAVTKQDLQDACGAVQTASGVSGGCEAAAHSLQSLWDKPETEVIFLVDARNAFNSMGRARALRSARIHCPTLATAFQNFYGSEGLLLLGDGKSLRSREGTTQGCPLGMAMFSINSVPLIAKVSRDGVIQVWYADDSAAGGTVTATHAWFKHLQEAGAEFGYEPRPEKCVAVVKPEAMSSFERTFGHLMGENGIQVVCPGIEPLEEEEGANAERLLGNRYLGAGLGTSAFREAWVAKKVEGWVEDVKKMSALGRTHPQVAYSLLVRTLIPRWRYSMRTTRCDPRVFDPLENALMEAFFPTVLGWVPDTNELRARCALPCRHGGLGIPVAGALARHEAKASTALTKQLHDAIISQDGDYRPDALAGKLMREERLRKRDVACKAEADTLAEGLDGRAARGFQEARLRGGSAWLSFAPLDSLGLGLDRVAFRDAVALRMGVPFPDPLPATCPSCGEPFSLDHALSCKRGGWVFRRHREVSRAWGRYFRRAGATAVNYEPLLPRLPPGAAARSTTTDSFGARADVHAVGLLSDEAIDDFFDIAVIDTGASRYDDKSSLRALEAYEKLKDAIYADRIVPIGRFTPLVCSIFGTLAPRAATTAHKVARAVDPDRDERDAVLDLHAVQIQAAIIKAVSLCLRARSSCKLPPLSKSQGLPQDVSGAMMGLGQEEP